MSDASVGPSPRVPLSLRAQIEQLLTDLRLAHHVSEDCWYSCPKSGESCREAAGDVCLCGADMHNAKLDALAAILASPQEPQEPKGWQPIATAPKNGDHILAIGIGDRVPSICHWWDGTMLNPPGWRVGAALVYPTHWMPLPLSPSPAAAPEQRKEPHEKTTTTI
jgi:hypothetical protein